MRIKLKFSKNSSPVPIHNQSLINSYINKCLGNNNPYHDVSGTYSISSLQGGRLNDDKITLDFKNGSYIVISSTDKNFIDELLKGVMLNPTIGHGMSFSDVNFIDEKFIDGDNHFFTLSPFILKEYDEDGKYKFITFENDPDFSMKLTNKVKTKLSTLDPSLKLDDFNIVVNNHPSHKVKKIMVKNVINKANQCKLTIHSNKQIAELLYNIGIGQSTNSGFGTIYKTENRHLYHEN